MLNSSLSTLLLAGLLVSATGSIAYAAEADNCTSSFYCYGSDATPAGATPVRIVVEGSDNQGTLIENVRRDVVAAPARPLAPLPSVLTNAPTATPTRVVANPTVNPTTRPSVLTSVAPTTPTRPVINLATRPSILTSNTVIPARSNRLTLPAVLDANPIPAAPVPRIAPPARPRAQLSPRTAPIATRPARRAETTISSIDSCGALIDKASKAESQGVVFAKNGQTTQSRQSFQAAANFRSQAKNLNCSV
ncbi:hypothetical protein [Thiofilum flexile]|uniref:hypothetical protein n=1 Tax=Thiofilum flexile TaxID=125627 RepID=UPI0003794CD2|nr:hypothetical protein [Thiofilum flexile]